MNYIDCHKIDAQNGPLKMYNCQKFALFDFPFYLNVPEALVDVLLVNVVPLTVPALIQRAGNELLVELLLAYDAELLVLTLIDHDDDDDDDLAVYHEIEAQLLMVAMEWLFDWYWLIPMYPHNLI